MKRIIFVGDKENLQQALTPRLKWVREDWQTAFAETAEQAFDAMSKEAPFDIAVSEMKLPDMDGVEFFTLLRERFPQTIRFGFLEEVDSRTLMRSSNITHQLLKWPCDPHNMHNQILRAFALRERLRDSSLKQTLLEIGSLPSLPVLYKEILEETQSERPSIVRIAQVIQKDVGMAAKVLQIANSSVIGRGQQVSDVVQAASLLGIDNLKNLVLMLEFSSMSQQYPLPAGFTLDALWKHSFLVAEAARILAKHVLEDSPIVEDAFTAGLLHDVGLVILATKIPEKLVQALELANAKNIMLFEAEKEVLGTTHAEVGGFLLELWGIPDPVVEAITFHNFPSTSLNATYSTTLDSGLSLQPESKFTALTAVHVAHYFLGDQEGDHAEDAKVQLDSVYMDWLEFTPNIEEWWNVCRTATR